MKSRTADKKTIIDKTLPFVGRFVGHRTGEIIALFTSGSTGSYKGVVVFNTTKSWKLGEAITTSSPDEWEVFNGEVIISN